ncbi:DUF222 domain-containing protein [Arthrobacter gandavensis]|uniref:HNH endonuclease n=1 Tax=Arthrobacter gandavensis TaxID=169960 RepID=UPI001890365F|nr:HNH endonuclease signature motif containing protein [Arthrobacter gandavensis]MBF4994255.1 DUF222 domain-containing protein [Arthrobacter gandavensis]
MFHADPAQAETTVPGSLPEGFTGQLSLRGPETLGYDETVSALQRVGMLISWAQAQQARVAARLEVLFVRDIAEASGGREEPALAMSLAAAEASTALNIPHMSAMQLISESTRLCSESPETLTRLSEGRIALQHARIILDETHNLPADLLEEPVPGDGSGGTGPERTGPPADGDSGQLDLGLNTPDAQDSANGPGTQDPPGAPDGTEPADEPGTEPGSDASGADRGSGAVLTVRGAFERDLLAAAEDRTAAGFGRRARRLRETRFPDLIPVRHRQAKDKRRVSFQPLPDGMSCLSAIIAAEKGQAMFAALTGAAKAGKRAGDPRTMDQLRADTLTDLLLEAPPEAQAATPDDRASASPSATEGREAGEDAQDSEATQGPRDVPGHGSGVAQAGAGTGGNSAGPVGQPRRAERHRNQNQNRNRNQNRSGVRTEVMVLINADTLAGLNENPAELNGYGPISADTARTMILNALHWTPLHWTPLLQNPATGEILTVGRTRRIPAGLKRWLQARDGTCRFPGCSVNVTHAEIDHTTPYSRGGPTDHANLEHLCPKHRFKTLGHWKARQPEPGTIEWNSPTGRTYTTDPAVDCVPGDLTSNSLRDNNKQPDIERRRYPYPPKGDARFGDFAPASSTRRTGSRSDNRGMNGIEDDPPPF